MSELIEKIIMNRVNEEIQSLLFIEESEVALMPYGSKCESIKKKLLLKYPDIDFLKQSDEIHKKLEQEEIRLAKISKEVDKKIKGSLVVEAEYKPNVSLLHTLLNERYSFEFEEDVDIIKELLCNDEKLNFFDSRRLQNSFVKVKKKFDLGKKLISVMGAL